MLCALSHYARVHDTPRTAVPENHRGRRLLIFFFFFWNINIYRLARVSCLTSRGCPLVYGAGRRLIVYYYYYHYLCSYRFSRLIYTYIIYLHNIGACSYWWYAIYLLDLFFSPSHLGGGVSDTLCASKTVTIKLRF